MIAVDSNILVYAHRHDAPFHEPAREAIQSLAEGRIGWAIPWPCLHGYYAVVTNPRLHRRPTPAEVALAQITAWVESPSLRLIAEGAGYLAALLRVAAATAPIASAIYDARIAAICLSHGVSELLTMDHDFSRYPELRTRSLLA
jgi:toxin-antitoxin system PIN domain toxin